MKNQKQISFKERLLVFNHETGGDSADRGLEAVNVPLRNKPESERYLAQAKKREIPFSRRVEVSREETARLPRSLYDPEDVKTDVSISDFNRKFPHLTEKRNQMEGHIKYYRAALMAAVDIAAIYKRNLPDNDRLSGSYILAVRVSVGAIRSMLQGLAEISIKLDPGVQKSSVLNDGKSRLETEVERTDRIKDAIYMLGDLTLRPLPVKHPLDYARDMVGMELMGLGETLDQKEKVRWIVMDIEEKFESPEFRSGLLRSGHVDRSVLAKYPQLQRAEIEEIYVASKSELYTIEYFFRSTEKRLKTEKITGLDISHLQTNIDRLVSDIKKIEQGTFDAKLYEKPRVTGAMAGLGEVIGPIKKFIAY